MHLLLQPGMGYKNLVYWSPRRAELGRCHVIRFQTHRHKMRTPSRGKMLQGKIFFHFLPLLSRVFESKCQNDALFYFHTPKINYVKAQHKILYQLATSEADWKCDGGGGCKIYKKILPPYWMPTPLPFTIMWFDWIWFEHHLIEYVQMLPPRIELLVCIFSIF